MPSRFLSITALALVIAGCHRTPPPTTVATAKATPDSSAASTAAAAKPATAPSGPKAYGDVITSKAKTQSGVFKVHEVGDKWYYEIPRSMTSREFLMVSRISRTASGIGYGGDEKNNDVLRWERRGNKVYLKQVSYTTVADTTQPIAIAVKNSNLEPIVQAFDIAAWGPDSSMVIEVGPFFLNDVALLGMPAAQKTTYQVRRLDPSRTYIDHIRTFPKNIENRVVLTYDAGASPQNAAAGSITLEMNHSMLLLPEVPMQARLMDDRVGYFGISQSDYGRQEQRTVVRRYIARWRLEPKDTAAFMRGELVEPIKPIVIYIDPATPKKWVPYLIQGVNDWQAAFEAAGFKNAIYAREAPTPQEDPGFSVDDARYSVIRYYASNVQNAMGPHVSDPRSGEILETHISWFHNVMNLLRNWYLVQTAAINPDARKVDFDDKVMGELIRFVSSHEVGHTIGLQHNMKSSSAYPVDSLRSPTFTAKYATAPSIMDYARFNYVAQPGDGAVAMNPKIGVYDKFAIAWGYRPILNAGTPDQEQQTLNAWIREHENDPMYWFGGSTGSDPSAQSEDLGDDGVKASNYGLANLKRILPQLITWTERPAEDYSQLRELYGQVASQHQQYLGHVATIIGGVDWVRKSTDQPGPAYTALPRERQKEAFKYIATNGLQTPTWLIDQKIFDRIGIAGATNRVVSTMTSSLSLLLNQARLTRLSETDALGYAEYPLPEYLGDVRGAVWTELTSGKVPDYYRRSLQRAWVDQMITFLRDPVPAAGAVQAPSPVSQSDIRAIARRELTTIRPQLNAAAGRGDAIGRAHYADLASRIGIALEGR